jgi:hypothetical protein
VTAIALGSVVAVAALLGVPAPAVAVPVTVRTASALQHRGVVTSTTTENTLSALAESLRRRSTNVEVDVRFQPDRPCCCTTTTWPS